MLQQSLNLSVNKRRARAENNNPVLGGQKEFNTTRLPRKITQRWINNCLFNPALDNFL